MNASRSGVRMIADGFAFTEGPRWHDGRLFFSDMGRSTVFATDLDGGVEEIVRVEERPSGLGWLSDGTMLVVSMGDRRVLRWDGSSLSEHADLSQLASYHCNDMVVDGRGDAYVGNAGFDMRTDEPRPAQVVLVRPDGSAEVVDDEPMFPNGSVVTPDNATLVIAETYANKLTAFDIGDDGTLTGRRTWAELPGRSPDGICLDAEGAIWVADASTNECVRVAAGGEILATVHADRRCFACALGGPHRTTLLMCTAEGFTGDSMRRRTGVIQAVEVDVPGAGWP